MEERIAFREALKDRTKQFALRVIKLYQALPKTGESKVIGNQLLRSATSVAANYRAACRGRSGKEFYSKMCIVVEEADEVLFWMELLKDSEIIASAKLADIMQESTEILKLMATIRKKTQPS